MFPTLLSRNVLPAVIRNAQILRSPAIFPAVYLTASHGFAPAAMNSRHKSTAVEKKKKPKKNSFPRSGFFDLEEFPSMMGLPFGLSPSLPHITVASTDLMDFLRQMDMADDLRREHFFSSPGYYIHANDENIKVTLSLPDEINKEDVTIEVKNDRMLHIKGERKTESDDGKLKSFTAFDKRFALGMNIDKNNIHATLNDKGDLTITATILEPTIAKKDTTKTIPITTIEKPIDEYDESDDIEALKPAV
jgi:HSP20 family molecular chaperone IbpA